MGKSGRGTHYIRLLVQLDWTRGTPCVCRGKARWEVSLPRVLREWYKSARPTETFPALRYQMCIIGDRPGLCASILRWKVTINLIYQLTITFDYSDCSCCPGDLMWVFDTKCKPSVVMVLLIYLYTSSSLFLRFVNNGMIKLPEPERIWSISMSPPDTLISV